MKKTNRRKFVKSLSGVAGALMLPTISFGSYNGGSNISFDNVGLEALDNSEAYWELVKSQFRFAPGLNYFNNASLGPSPISVQNATQNYRTLLDGFPSKYMWGEWKDDIEKTRKGLADLFSVSEEEIALNHNTTEGINLIARSFELKAGDEIILADHEHPSGTVAWEVWQERKGVKLVRPQLPMMPQSIEEVVEVYRNAITPKTRIISMCHIVNTTGMILPVKEISEMAHQRGILVAVDGAQSAGMFQFNLHDLGCDFYTASAHKWLFAPKGIGLFYAKKESQHHLKPLIVARGHEEESIRRLENYNTRNLPELLGMGEAVTFYNTIGQQKINERSFELKKYFRSKIENNSKFKLKTPSGNNLSCAIQVVEVIGKDVKETKALLFGNYGIDCRPMSSFDLNALRFSFAIYITKKDIDYLVDALIEV